MTRNDKMAPKAKLLKSSDSESIVSALDFKALPRANKDAVAHFKPKTEAEKMLYSITTDGRIKLHRDLSKWKSKGISKSHAVYYDTAPSPEEERANKAMQALISKVTREKTEEQESAIAIHAMRKQERLDAVANS